MAKKEERGYYNAVFNKLDWAEKKQEIIKTFAMTEICILSDYHIGCRLAVVNHYIRSVRHVSEKPYYENVLGEKRGGYMEE